MALASAFSATSKSFWASAPREYSSCAALERLAGERFVGGCLVIVAHRCGEVRAGNHKQNLALFHVVAEPDFEIGNAARTKRGDADSFIHVRLDGPVGVQFRGQVASFPP